MVNFNLTIVQIWTRLLFKISHTLGTPIRDLEISIIQISTGHTPVVLVKVRASSINLTPIWTYFHQITISSHSKMNRIQGMLTKIPISTQTSTIKMDTSRITLHLQIRNFPGTRTKISNIKGISMASQGSRTRILELHTQLIHINPTDIGEWRDKSRITHSKIRFQEVRVWTRCWNLFIFNELNFSPKICCFKKSWLWIDKDFFIAFRLVRHG